jgi:hypothetical protein
MFEPPPTDTGLTDGGGFMGARFMGAGHMDMSRYMTVPDDRLVASTQLLQSAHPGSALHVATSDINLQTKLSAVGLPFVEPPSP